MKTRHAGWARHGVWRVPVLGIGLLLAGCDLVSEPPGLGERHHFGDNDPNLVIALGDSVTLGRDLQPYPAILGGMIGKTVVNAGVGGNKARDGAARLPGLLRQKPGYVLILFGLNDAIHGVQIDNTMNALRAMVCETRRNGSIPVLGTLPPQTGSYERISGHVAALNVEITALARQLVVPLADIAGEVDVEGISQDGLHPNQEGLRAIAAAFADWF